MGPPRFPIRGKVVPSTQYDYRSTQTIGTFLLRKTLTKVLDLARLYIVMSQNEQRKTTRFELRLPIELVRSGAESIGKMTETRNLSSGGVLFASESRLPVGEQIEYFITLPTGKAPNGVRLHCMGTVIRLEMRSSPTAREKERPFNVAATLERYEFVRAI